MGTIAARDCIRSLELTEQVAAACTFASAQALELRKQKTDLNDELIGPSMSLFQKTVLKEVDFVTEDRRLDKDLRKLVQLIQSRKWNLYV
jgi:histidine ammonia-lyase